MVKNEPIAAAVEKAEPSKKDTTGTRRGVL